MHVAIEPLEDRRLLAAQAVDLGQLRFFGDFVQVGNTYTATGDVQLGLIPDGADAFQPLIEFTVDQGGELTFTVGSSDPSFTVQDVTMSSIVQAATTTQPAEIALWSIDGSFSFDADLLAGAGVELTSGAAQPFTLAGSQMAAQAIRLNNPGVTDGAEVLLDGTLTITAQSDLTVAVEGSAPARINAQGPSLPDFQVELLTSFTLVDLTFDPSDMSIGYTSNDETFSIWGVGTLSTADGGLSSVTADLGSSDQANVTIVEGALSGFTVRLEGESTEVFKLKLASYDLTLTSSQTGAGITGYGSVVLGNSTFEMLDSALVGTSEMPGLAIQSGHIDQFTIDIDGSLLFGPLPFHTKNDPDDRTDGVTISYMSDTTFDLTGAFEVPELFDASVTFASPNGLIIKDGDLHLDGLTIELTDVYLGAFVLDDLIVGYADENGVIDFDVSAKLWFPGAFWVEATFDFIGAKLNTIGIDFKLTGGGQGIAIGDTGLFIIGMGAEVQNLVNPRDLIISGAVSLSYGPTESFTVFGKTAEATLLQLDGNFLVDRHEFSAEVDAYVGAYTLGDSTSGLFGEAKAVLTFDWTEGKYEVEVEGGYYDGTFKGKFVADFQSDLFAVLADLEVDVPDAVPFIGGDTLGSLDFALLDVFGHTDQSFMAAWAKINLLIHTFHIGFEYTFDGSFNIISGKQIDAIEHEVENPSPQVYNYSATFMPPDGATHATFHVDWGDVAGEQSIAILPPGFDAPVSASDFSSYQHPGDIGLSLVPAFTTESSIGMHIVGLTGVPEAPLMPGPYKLILTSNLELTPTWTSVFGYTEPTITLGPLTDANPTVSPVMVPVSTTIEPTFFEQARVTLYIDTQSDGYGGRPVKGATNVPIPAVPESSPWPLPWDLTGLNSQPYYLYASINDGFNAPVYSKYIGPFTPTPPIGGVVTDPIHGNAVPGVTVYLDLNGNGRYDVGTDLHDVTNQQGKYAFFSLSPLPGFNEYTVGVVVPPGFQLDPDSSALVEVEYLGNPLTVDFEIDEFASINGTVFVDANQNGTYDPGETLLSGWTVHLDLNGNGLLDAGELTARTNSQGAYAFYNLDTNTSYTVRRVLQPDFYDTGEASAHAASIGGDPFQKVTGLDFGVLPFSTISGNIAGHAVAGGMLNADTTPLEGWSVVVTQQTAINAGGAAAGAYRVDGDFTGATESVTFDHSINTNLVAAPAPLSVYQTSRYGSDFSYQVSGLTTNVLYQVRLDFVETLWDDPGDRIFNVAINGQTVLENFDILATALAQGQGTGKFVALAPTFTAVPEGPDGDTITIRFTAVTDNAMVNGIVVSALTTSQAVNSGGVAEGSFRADGEFSGGQAAPPSTSPIVTTGVPAPAPQEVYQTNRYGEHVSYTVDGLIFGARYAVRLHFAETFWTAPGQRVFDVLINGEAVLVDFDIFAAAGGQNVAIVQTFGALAEADAGGSIVIDFIASVDNAQINGIEIIGGVATAVTDASGNYSVGGLRLGDYVVTQVVPSGWREISPFTSDLVLITPAGSDFQSVRGGVRALPPAIGDFDDDGKLDFAVIDADGANLLIYHNGDLDNPTAYSHGVGISALVAADMLGAGRAGIAFLDDLWNLYFLRNDGPDTKLVNIGSDFNLGVSFDDHATIVGMAKGFFVPDDGGNEQIAVTYQVTQSDGASIFYVVVLGYLDGEPNPVWIYQETAISQAPSSMAVGDVNRDGFDDVLLGFDEDQSPLLVYGNATNLAVSLDVLVAFGQVVLGDINTDGFLDVGILDWNGNFFYAIQTSSGLFPSAVHAQFWNPVFAVNGALLRDINGDFMPDLVALVDGGFNQQLVVVLNSGQESGWFSLAAASSMSLPHDTGGTQAFAAADLDGDSLLDLIIVNSDAGFAEIVRNRSITAPAPIFATLDGQNATNLDFVNAEIGQINGRSFDDVTRSGNPGLAHPGRGGDTVYLDLNRNGRLDAGEPTAVTSATGHYAFDGLEPGTYLVRLAVPDGRRLTHPASGSHEVVVGNGSPPILDAHFGSTVALSVTWTIPRDSATADWTIVRNGDRIEVLDALIGVVAGERLDDIESITIIGAAGRANKLTIDMTAGGAFAPPGGIAFVGTGADDRLKVQLGSGNDLVTIDGSFATVNDQLDLSWSKVSLLSIAADGGDDRFVVSGQPVARHGLVELQGGAGDDIYDLATNKTRIRIVDESGVDTIDFHRSPAAKRIDLSSDSGRWQKIDRLGNWIALVGIIENVVGTEHADTLIGNAADNILVGLGGRDLLIGREGDDLLIGGAARDRLHGRAGEDLLIGGATVFDENIAALLALFAEWTSEHAYNVRIANLARGDGSADRMNGDWFLDDTTLIDDLARNLLSGGKRSDWFVVGPRGMVKGRRPGEVVSVIDQSDHTGHADFERSHLDRRWNDLVAARGRSARCAPAFDEDLSAVADIRVGGAALPDASAGRVLKDQRRGG